MTRVYREMILDYAMGFEIEDHKYRISVQHYDNVAGYAPVMIIDNTNNERYLSDGYIEINGDTIITKWGIEYNRNRDNYVCNRDLIVTVC